MVSDFTQVFARPPWDHLVAVSFQTDGKHSRVSVLGGGQNSFVFFLEAVNPEVDGVFSGNLKSLGDDQSFANWSVGLKKVIVMGTLSLFSFSNWSHFWTVVSQIYFDKNN